MKNEIMSDDELQSRSELKRIAQQIGDYVIQLTELPVSAIDKLNVDIDDLELLKTIKQMPPSTSKNRELRRANNRFAHYGLDMMEKLAKSTENYDRKQAKQETIVYQWFEKLLADSSNVTEFANKYSGVNIQQLRQLVRQTGKIAENPEQSGNGKKLLGLIRGALG